MKKIILLFTFIIMSVVAFSQPKVDSAMNKLADSSKLTVSKVYNDVKAGISGLASALKVRAEHVYEVMVRQQVVESITNITKYLIFGIIIWVCFRLVFKHLKKDPHNDLEDAEAGVPFFIGIIFLIIWVIIFISTINETVTGFVNPEYGAIKAIINFIK